MNATPQRFLSPRGFAGILGFLVAIQFPLVLLGVKTFFFRDFGFFGYPLAAYHREAFWSGEVPLWNPYNNAGLPFLAQWNTMVLYPGSFIYLLLPLPWSLNFFCLAHQFVAGMGMYFLARHTTKSDLGAAVAGVAFAFSGLLLSSLKWPNNIAAFGWMPFVVLAVVRMFETPGARPIAIAALVGSLQMLAGAPEVIILTWVVAGTLGLGECIAQRCPCPLLKLAAVCALVAAICAAQLLPFLELLKLSQRTGEFAAADWPMPIWGWANFLVPLWRAFPSFHGVPAQLEQYWTSTYYVPIFALAAASVAWRMGWRARTLAGLAIFGAVLALGNDGFVYKALREVFPPLGFMRFPIKFVVLPVFLLPWLAAYGLASDLKLRGPAIVLAIMTFAVMMLPRLSEIPQFQFSEVLLNGFLRIAFLAGAIALLRARAKAFAVLAILPLLWLDARTHAPDQNPTAAPWVFDRDLEKIENRPRLGMGRAMMTPEANAKLDHLMFDSPENDMSASRLSLYANANLISRVPKANGFFSLYLKEPNHLIDLIYATTNRAFIGLAKTLAATHFTAPGKTVDWMQAAERMAWLAAGQKVISTNKAGILQAIIADDFDPSKTLYLEGARPERPGSGRVDIIFKVEPQRIVGETQAAAAGWMFISQAFDPNWRAKVNGADVPIQRANYAFQAIEIPAGKASFELRYESDAFRRGGVVSGIAAMATVLLGVLGRPRENKNPNAHAAHSG